MSAKKFRPKKALLKRIKITSKGKLLRRFTRLNHFNAKESGDKIREQRGELPLSKPDERAAKKLLPL